MFIEQLKTGERVQIQHPSSGKTDGHMSKVELLIPEAEEVLVSAPFEKGRLVRFRTGDKCTLRLLKGAATFRFQAKMVRYDTVDGFDVLRLKLTDGGEKVQRRDAFRFNCALPVDFSIIYSSGESSERFEGIVADLSAGGCKIFTSTTLHTGYLLNIGIQLGEDQLTAFGDVRMKKELPRGSKHSFQYGIRFTLLPESDQERIIRFMYKMQREQLKKARGR